MKVTFFGFLMAGLLIFTACNNESKPTQKSSTQPTKGAEAPGPAATAPADAAKAATPVSPIVASYLQVKNALAADDGAAAAAGAQAMTAALTRIEASSFSPEQKKMYSEVADDLKEQAEHTAANAGKIDHQREHFVNMSEDVRDLVKTFGAGQTLYLDHCPMANDKKGANWISETAEIKNPYMGKKMPTCGKVQETIKP